MQYIACGPRYSKARGNPRMGRIHFLSEYGLNSDVLQRALLDFRRLDSQLHARQGAGRSRVLALEESPGSNAYRMPGNARPV